MSVALAEQRFGVSLATSKILPRHLTRLAVVYVRQSTMHQTAHHQESTRLQYDLLERAVSLGWPRERVMVIDDDLGRSGANSEGRPGFQRLVAEVGLDHVGLILGIEISRLARSCRDWHHLLEVCALFGCLISDLDGLYDPTHYNDRLLLGLKGTMSEAELHVLKQRMQAAKLTKAQRGALGMPVPIGYVRRPSGEIAKDPDEQAQHAVASVFELFQARGTVRGVLCYLVEHDVRLPIRIASGPNKGELSWRVANAVTLRNLLTNPAYAGAYVYGRRATDPRAKKPGRPGTGRKGMPVKQWLVCLRDRLPAYISWEQFEQNLRQMSLNRSASRGVARKGAALVAGMVRCGRCGRRMVVRYKEGRHSYSCDYEMAVRAGAFCQSLSAAPVDRCVEALLLRALEPASLELSMAVAENLEKERLREEKQWQLRLERARYEVGRARRQYELVEPENRLVARMLERTLEEKLQAERKLQEDHRRIQVSRPAALTDLEREAIRKLSTELPSLWNSATTTVEQKKTIARQLIEEVRVTVIGESERVDVLVRWAGGHETRTWVARPVAKLSQLSYYPALVERVLQLRAEERTWESVAEALNLEGWRPAKRRTTFTPEMASSLIENHKQEGRMPRNAELALGQDEWTPTELAKELGMSRVTLVRWITKGIAKARKAPSVTYRHGEWIVWADAKEKERLRALHTAPRSRWSRLRNVAAQKGE